MTAAPVTRVLERLLGPLKPGRVCLIGHLPELDLAHSDAIRGHLSDFTQLAPDEALTALPALPTQDLVAVGQSLEVLDQRTGDQLLAGLRDLHARRVLLRLDPNPGPWGHRQIMAFGFQCLFRLPDAPHTAFYGFDLGNYKVTPDWLNPKHWANPELFDRYRW